MKVGIITITWNRLWYTYHCLKLLKEKAGYPYKHVIVDNGSTDGSPEFLEEEFYEVIRNKENVGISRAMYQAKERLGGVDLIIKFDNDCELITDDIVAKTVRFLERNPGYIISPVIKGLNHPPKVHNEVKIDGVTFCETGHIGGIYYTHPAKDMIPANINNGEGIDDVTSSMYYRSIGYRVGYIKEWEANHFETTNGQEARYGADKKYIF